MSGVVVGILRKDGWTQLTVAPGSDPKAVSEYLHTRAVRCREGGEPVRLKDAIRWDRDRPAVVTVGRQRLPCVMPPMPPE